MTHGTSSSSSSLFSSWQRRLFITWTAAVLLLLTVTYQRSFVVKAFSSPPSFVSLSTPINVEFSYHNQFRKRNGHDIFSQQLQHQPQMFIPISHQHGFDLIIRRKRSMIIRRMVSNNDDNENYKDVSQQPMTTTKNSLKEEAEALKAQAVRLRQEINELSSEQSLPVSSSSPQLEAVSTTIRTTPVDSIQSSASPWDIVPSYTASSSSSRTTTTTTPTSLEIEEQQGDKEQKAESVNENENLVDGEEYRLYVDIGREDGTWMDPRWGASGNRIEFTIDVRLCNNHQRQEAEEGIVTEPPNNDDNEEDDTTATNTQIRRFEDAMVKDNTMGSSSNVMGVDTAKFARLRDGFDRMECYGGAYRIDQDRAGRYTLRLVLDVEGTVKADQQYIYGDVNVPTGYLYFSLPVFGGNISQLSTKEGPVTVRQVGWHTGWRRQESRIVGVFKAKRLADAKRIDGY